MELHKGLQMKRAVGLLLMLWALVSVPVMANPPMKVVYSSSSTTHFNWTWPYHPVRVYTAVQTKPYYYTGRLLYLSQEDVSKYRFYYPDRTCRNEWGYFFVPGTKLCPRHPIIIFGDPYAYTEFIYLK